MRLANIFNFEATCSIIEFELPSQYSPQYPRIKLTKCPLNKLTFLIKLRSQHLWVQVAFTHHTN